MREELETARTDLKSLEEYKERVKDAKKQIEEKKVCFVYHYSFRKEFLQNLNAEEVAVNYASHF